jgi:hypothetical protein
MGIGYFYQKIIEMDRVFIFLDDDFIELDETELQPMENRRLVESLQGTLIGLHTIKEVTNGINLVDMGPYAQFKKLDNNINESLIKGLAALISQLEPRLGRESVERIISETIFMVNLDNKQDGK